MPLIENVWFSIRFVDILFPLIENVLFSIRAKVLCWLGQRTVFYPRPVLHVLIETNLLFVYIICNTISLQQYYTLILCPLPLFICILCIPLITVLPRRRRQSAKSLKQGSISNTTRPGFTRYTFYCFPASKFIQSQ